MIETFYYGALAVAFAWALIDWRRGLYLCLLFDVIRDPVRKLAAGNSVAITLAGVALWLAVFMGAYTTLGPRLFTVLGQWRPLRTGSAFLLLALIPAALVSLVSYPAGWMLAGVGFVSYTLPIVGIVVGFHLLRRTEDVWRLLAAYCLINAVALSGSLCEFLHVDLPALGGIKTTWIRYEGHTLVRLISGFYRSPDVMGLHAANVAMFGTLLGVQRSGRFRWLWIALSVWGAFCLLISGRRKMIGMLLVFGGIYVALKLRNSGMGRTVPLLSLLLAIVLAFALVLYTTDGTQSYITYAQTLVTGSTERLTDNVIGGAIETVRQSGLLGIGLGTATQGNYYASNSSIPLAWQEDGFSRIFAEFGLLGAVLVLLAVMNFGKAFRMALKMVPPQAPVRELQFGLTGVIAASIASFIISHQVFSGDPFSLLFVFLLAGVVLSGPLHREAPLSRPVRATNRSFARQQPMAMSGPGLRR